ncbi:alpha/beta fold hydrolase [Pigmentiphaga sp.]|uniref:alpha/beta fold hydrolase n=1 Tax=Pigmentiphaga sp. TaxID=1977564 RepID=UPI0025FC6FBD|nr:alpha/beta fold hydrolase [Pigmentiphaga sp.]
MRSTIIQLFRATVLVLGLAGAGLAVAADPGHYAELPGVKLWYTDSGGSGTPLILMHANTGTSETWPEQIGAFAAAGYRVIAFDRRGWGKSMAEPASGEQPGSVSGDLDALIGHLKLDKVFLVGVAGGGFSALDYAAWRPGRVRAMVVAASSARLDAEPEMKALTARIDMPGRRKLPVVYMEVSPAYRSADPAGTELWMHHEEHARQKGAADQPLRTANTYAKLESITAPTLVVAGGADLIAPPGLMRVWASHVKGSEFKVIGDAGHAVSWEQPHAFNAAVLDFLRRH